MNGLIKKVLFEKAKEVPLKNIISSIKTVESELNSNEKKTSKNKSKFNQPLSQLDVAQNPFSQSKSVISKDERFGFLNSKAITYAHGWNTINVSLCEQTSKNIFIDANSGDFHCLKCSKSGDWTVFKSLADSVREKRYFFLNFDLLQSEI
jgi:hypothetical protein